MEKNNGSRGLPAANLPRWNLAVCGRRCELVITAYCDGLRGRAKLVGGTEESHWPLCEEKIQRVAVIVDGRDSDLLPLHKYFPSGNIAAREQLDGILEHGALPLIFSCGR
jgi:hypothetical protein